MIPVQGELRGSAAVNQGQPRVPYFPDMFTMTTELRGNKTSSQDTKTKLGSVRCMARQDIPAVELKQGPRLRFELNLAPKLDEEVPSKAAHSSFS